MVVALIALGVWWHSTYSEDTDDAQVNGHLIQVSSRIAGQVAKVYVEENQLVKAGDPIAELDPQRLPGRGGERRGRAGQRQGECRGRQGERAHHHHQHRQQPALGRRRRHRRAGQRGAGRAAIGGGAGAAWPRPRPTTPRRRPIWRATSRWSKKTSSASSSSTPPWPRPMPRKADAGRCARQRAGCAGRRARGPRARDAGPGDAEVRPDRSPAGGRAGCPRQAGRGPGQQAQAQLDQAKLNLELYKNRCARGRHHHPQERRRSIRTSPRGRTCSRWSRSRICGSRRTSRRRSCGTCAAGQTVEIHVDSTGKDYSGRVTQIGGATGSVLSLFPPENATGNYVKVVQRVPVRIDFTDWQKRRPHARSSGRDCRLSPR